jgi:hypothetical protein
MHLNRLHAEKSESIILVVLVVNGSESTLKKDLSNCLENF